MPQIAKGGKFIFGKSLIHEDLTITFPPQAVLEYDITSEGKVILFTGSKTTGGFCVTRRELLLSSKIANILEENPKLNFYSSNEGEFVKYKGKSYCWIHISKSGSIRMTKEMMNFLNITTGMQLFSIRSSNIAFTMGAKGKLFDAVNNYEGNIEVF